MGNFAWDLIVPKSRSMQNSAPEYVTIGSDAMAVDNK